MRKPVLSFLKMAVLLLAAINIHHAVFAQAKSATVKLNKAQTYQKITGFGGFVNSPTFGYNYMTEAEIRKMWGQQSQGGLNIMRLYIPVGKESWPQSVATAQLAQSLGIKIFASPWSMPTEWKTYNTLASQYTDANGVKQPVYLKTENYQDYANYLNDYVTYLKNNGVTLEAISLQNEPDYQVDYAGCIWTPDQMANFIKNYGSLINCKVMAPETVGILDRYATSFLAADVLPHFDIFAGHQYGDIQSGLLNVQAKGKEVWMSEFLINWNANGTSRNADWSIDGFAFVNKLNDALLANVNAWVHYATKRYYGPMGDGQFGTTTGVLTKRGEILAQYAKYVTGTTRIQNTWSDNTGQLSGSSYIVDSGDKVVVMVINPSASAYNLTVDLPFLTNEGKSITISGSESMVERPVSTSQPTNRPKAAIAASSVTTLIFTKSGDFVPSQMTGEVVNYDKVENRTPTSAAFGSGYMLSGKTVTFKSGSPLFSSNINTNNGYLPLGKKFNRLVFQVESLSSALNYSASSVTLYYVNKAGNVSLKNYGSINFASRSNFSWVLDISEDVLTDGCIGIIGIQTGNAVSVLTFKFKNVYFAVGSERGYKFAGVYSGIDGTLLDCLDDVTYTSLDFTNTTDIPAQTDWHSVAANRNSIFYVQSGVLNNKTNVVSGNVCNKLELSDTGGDFYAPVGFTATSATYSCTLNGLKMLVLPFEATIPNGVKAYTLELVDPKVVGKQINTGKLPANTPVLVDGSGSFVFTGAGAIASSINIQTGITGGVYIGIKVPIGGYYLTNSNATKQFSRVTSGAQPAISSFDAYLVPGLSTTASTLALDLRDNVSPVALTSPANGTITDGQPTFSGTAPASSTVTVTVLNQSGNPVRTLTTTASSPLGSFKIDLPSDQALPSGSYTAYAQAQSADQSSNVSPQVSFTVDATVASVSITPSNATLTCASPTATLTAVGTGTVRWNTGATTASIIVSTADIYSVTLTAPNGSTASATTDVTSNTIASAAPVIATQSGGPYPAGVSSLTISQNTGNIILVVSGCQDGTINWNGGSSSTLAVPTANLGVQSFTATCTSTQNGCSSSIATATVTVVAPTLKVLSRDPDNGQLGNNTIKPYLLLQNAGTTPIPYANITLRYWLTTENNIPLIFQKNYVAIGQNNLNLRYVPISPSRQGVTGYVEYSFNAGAVSLTPNGDSGPLEIQLNKQDYSNFVQSDDYSYINNSSFTLNPRITAYQNGVIFYGQEPTGSGNPRLATAEAGSHLLVNVLGNPVVGQSAEVEIRGVTGQAVQVKLIDMHGKMVHGHSIKEANPVERISLPLSNAQGILVLDVSTATQRQQVKLVRP